MFLTYSDRAHIPGTHRTGSPYAGRLTIRCGRVITFVDAHGNELGSTVVSPNEGVGSPRIRSIKPMGTTGYTERHVRHGAIELVLGDRQVAVAGY